MGNLSYPKHMAKHEQAKNVVLTYKGFYESVNEKPRGEWIEIFVSDWFKDYWGFYAYISLENYERDIEAINSLIHRLNWRDGDVYVELINRSEGLKDFYHWLYEKSYFTHHCALDPENWRKCYTQEQTTTTKKSILPFKNQKQQNNKREGGRKEMPKKGYTGISLKTEVAQFLRKSKGSKLGRKRLPNNSLKE